MNIYKLPAITNSEIFESLIVDYMNFRYNTTSFQKYGRRGQEQSGIDIISLEHHCAIQCKVISQPLRTKSQLNSKIKEITEDILAAYNSHLPIKKLIIATTLPRDVNFYSKDNPFFYNSHSGFLMLEFWSWDDICEGVTSYPILLKKLFGSFKPDTTITVLSVLPKSVYKKTETNKIKSFGHDFFYKYQNPKRRNHLPIFDISVINNSDETILLTSIDAYAERTAVLGGFPTEPIGELRPYKKYKINLDFSFNKQYLPNKSTLEFDNPIYLYPKAPLRIQLQGNKVINAPSRVRLAFNFNNTTIFTDYFYFECVSSSMMPMLHSEQMLKDRLTSSNRLDFDKPLKKGSY